MPLLSWKKLCMHTYGLAARYCFCDEHASSVRTLSCTLPLSKNHSGLAILSGYRKQSFCKHIQLIAMSVSVFRLAGVFSVLMTSVSA